MTDSDLIDRLVAAQRAGDAAVDYAPYAMLDRAGAYRVQLGVLHALNQTVGLLKTAVQADGVGVAAPIYGSNVRTAPARLSLPSAIGLEVEVGVVLKTDLPADPGVDLARVAAAVDHYFLGVEICATRYPDRKAAGPNGSLADNMSGLGYVIGARRADGAIAGVEVRLEFGGKVIHAAPAKHAFGEVLTSLVAYAKSQQPAYPLKAGAIVTTGSMCGLVAASGPGHVRATFGDETLEFDLV